MLTRVALASLWNRRLAASLGVFTIAISVALLLAVERVRAQTRSSFASTISGTDLIVGARTAPVQLLLYSVFRIGDPTQSISYARFEEIAAHPQVAWTIPISLGDGHRGYRVLATNNDYFAHYKYGDRASLEFAIGRHFDQDFDAVLGAEIAQKLKYSVGDRIEIGHGAGRKDLALHADNPFTIIGILRPTGTPVDRTLHVPLAGLDAIHAHFPGTSGKSSQSATDEEHAHGALSAVFLGLKNRAAAFGIQRQINDYPAEPLLAILPGLALAQLWNIVGVGEAALLSIAVCVVVAGLLGMLTSLVTTLDQRRREMAILRSVGAKPRHIAALLMVESCLLASLGAALGWATVSFGLLLLAPTLASQFGLYVSPWQASAHEGWLLLGVLAGGAIAGLIPAALAYRRTLADGLSMRA